MGWRCHWLDLVHHTRVDLAMRRLCMHSKLDTGSKFIQNLYKTSNLEFTVSRLIDTAQRYGCEQLLAVAIQESKLNREEIFLTDKVFLKNIHVETRHVDNLRSGRATMGRVAAWNRSPKVLNFWAPTIWTCSCCTGQVPIRRRFVTVPFRA